jgi:hypothetical protein
MPGCISEGDVFVSSDPPRFGEGDQVNSSTVCTEKRLNKRDGVKINDCGSLQYLDSISSDNYRRLGWRVILAIPHPVHPRR